MLSPQLTAGGWHTYAFLRDVRERQRGEARTRLLAQVVEACVDAICTTYLQGSITSWNSSAQQLYGWPAGAVLGTGLDRLLPVGELDALAADVFRTGGAQQVRTRCQVRTGAPVEVSLSLAALLDGTGVQVGFSLHARNLTAQRATERQRDTHDLMLRGVIANSQSLVYVKDLQGRYLLANEPFQRAFGVTEVELLGKDDKASMKSVRSRVRPSLAQ